MPLRIALVLFSLTVSSFAFSQKWTTSQLEAANTAKDVSVISQAERDAIMYINLCRLYPSEFARIEVEGYEMDPRYGQSYIKKFHKYKKSLLEDLPSRAPVKALYFDNTLYLDAKCYSNEISKASRNGHERIDCAPSNYGECLSFGQESGKDITLQWLVDTDIEDLGHRAICLEKSYSKIGLSANKHFKYRFCAVSEFM